MDNAVTETPPAKLAPVQIQTIVDRIAAGEYQSHIAKEMGIAPVTMHRQVSTHPDYRQALQERNRTKLDQAQDSIETQEEISRAREAFKAAAWRAERESPEVWGQKNQLHITGSLTLDSLLDEAAAIPGQAERVDDE